MISTRAIRCRRELGCGWHTHGTVYPPGKLVANAVEGNPAVLIVILLEAETTPVAVAAPEEETITD